MDSTNEGHTTDSNESYEAVEAHERSVEDMADDIEAMLEEMAGDESDLADIEDAEDEDDEEAEEDEDDDSDADLDDDDDSDDGDDDSDDGEDDSDDDGEGEPEAKNKKGDRDYRIERLLRQRDKAKTEAEKLREAAEENERLKAELAEAQKLSVITTEDHPDPENELAELKARFASVKTPQQVLEEGLINPLTGEPFTPAEAVATIAEHKQNLQFQIGKIQSAVVENMTKARQSETLISNELTPSLEKLLDKHPELDPESKKYDQDIADLLQAVIDTNVEMDRGLVTGFKKSPKDFIAAFERVLIKGSTLKVNQNKEISKKVDKTVPKRGAQDNRAKTSQKSSEDELMEMFDAEMKSMSNQW